MAPDYGLKVAEDFQEYLRTGESRLIEQYSSRELKTMITRLEPYYNNRLWYRELARRIEKLDSKRRTKEEGVLQDLALWRERWLVPIMAFLLGLIGGSFLPIL